MDAVKEHEYHVRDLPTRSVTLFPSRAQVIRDIKDVPLQPGANQITILGLTPTIDEHSVKVEGSGSAIITDIALELLPNRDIFQDIYPDLDDDDDDDDDHDSDSDADIADSAELEKLREKLSALRDEQKRAKEIVASAESRLKILDAYGQALDKKRGVDIRGELETYRRERDTVFQDHMAGFAQERKLSLELDQLLKEERGLERQANKAKAKAQKVREKEREKKRRRKGEAAKEKARIRREPFTPASSRRASIASDISLVKPAAADYKEDADTAGVQCDISLSYVTSSAFWSPSYDLALSTTSGTATLCFDAKLSNMTSEVWSSTKIVLSTSETSFRGLGDDIPVLLPWRLKLAGKNGGASGRTDVVESPEERNQRTTWQAQKTNHLANTQKNRHQLFGMDLCGAQPAAALGAPPPLRPVPAPAQAPVQSWVAAQQDRGGVFSHASASQMQQAIQQQPRLMMEPGAQNSMFSLGYGRGPGALFGSAQTAAAAGSGQPPADTDDETIRPEAAAPEMAFQESALEETTGLTTTYDVPGLKTLSPRATAAKQRVARIVFNGVAFSHVVVAKYKPVAFLKAKLRNTSKLTILHGPAGLTLDGAFLGRSSLPRCSAGDLFTLSLGVDPAIKVVYAKPEVKRSTTGLFSKEDSSAFIRTITLANTRASSGKPVHLLVLDQVPVSEDEKLRIELMQPRGLVLGGSGVATGVAGRSGEVEREWGKATALLKKGGEVVWEVALNAGKSAKLSLAYEMALPSGEQAMPC